MRTAIVGAGPTGLYLGMALARRGHVVTIVDRDTGPEGDRWDRKGVMQFHHPHGFRQQVIEALLAEMPDVWEQLIAAGRRTDDTSQPSPAGGLSLSSHGFRAGPAVRCSSGTRGRAPHRAH
jgi:2-polyprenyl-6-methoxyphenol hydroxylase-like FAD-dependent oxidoreductase